MVTIPYQVDPAQSIASFKKEGDSLETVLSSALTPDAAYILGAVKNTVFVETYNTNGELSTPDDDSALFLHVENYCLLDGNYRCAEQTNGSNYTELPQLLPMEHLTDSKFSVDFVINRVGKVTLSVVLARRGGLYGEYFNNVQMQGTAVKSGVDATINFDWGENKLTDQSGDYVSAHWFGKLLAPRTEPFTFILNGDDGFRLFVDKKLKIDRWNSCCDQMTVILDLVEGVFYDIVLEYKELQHSASLKLEWESPSVQRGVIPSSNLFSTFRVANQVF